MQTRFLALMICALVLASPLTRAAMNPTPAQIEAFKKLPKSQQKALARQMGVSYQDLDKLLSTTNQADNTSPDMQQAALVKQQTEARVKARREELKKSEEGGPNKEILPFGYDLFAGEPTTFTPVTDIPVPSKYILGPGDHLSIQLFGKDNDELDLEVNRRGEIAYPQLGPIVVAGMQLQDAITLLRAKIKAEFIGVRASISLGQLRSIRIFVLGDAYRPGSYEVSALSTITNALFASGGIKPIGSLRNIQLKRDGKVMAQLDLYDLLLHGDTSGDQRLLAGDVVFIPPVKNRVWISGAVNRPAIYEFKQGTSVAQVLKLAGGLKANANRRHINILRIGTGGMYTSISLDLSQPPSAKTSIKSGDKIEIGEQAEYVNRSIELKGAVTHPGFYHWHKGLRLRDILPSFNADLLPKADMQYGFILREINESHDVRIHQFNLSRGDNPQLAAQDQIYVVGNPELTIDEWTRQMIRRRDQLMQLYGLDQLQESAQNAASNNLLGGGQQRPALVPIRAKNEARAEEETGAVNSRGKLGKPQVDLLSQDVNVSKDVLGWKKRDVAYLTDLAESVKDERLELMLSSREILMPEIMRRLNSQARFGFPLQVYQIQGAVRSPGSYPIPANTTVENVISAAGGLLDSAYVMTAEITRRQVEQGGLSIRHQSIVLEDALKNNQALKIGSRDSINVRSVPEWSERGTVQLLGEFKFPGTYTVRKGETLKEVLERAGGLSAEADPRATIFTRERLRKLEQRQLAKVADQLKSQLATRAIGTGRGNVKNLSALVSTIEHTKAVGRLVIDLPSMLADKTPDLAMEDGDKLIIPSISNTVTVLGEVSHPTSHLLDSAMSVDGYIERSGGMTSQADDSRVFVVRSNGSVMIPDDSHWFSSDDGQLEAGDTIIVPVNTEYMTSLNRWTRITQIIYQSAVALAAVSRL